jgi:hypothetical protein
LGTIHGPYHGGELITVPPLFEGEALWLNCASSVAGSVRDEVQDRERTTLPKFTLEGANPLVGDEITDRVQGRGGGRVGALAGRPVRLRFVLRDADLYSLQFSETDKRPPTG